MKTRKGYIELFSTWYSNANKETDYVMKFLDWTCNLELLCQCTESVSEEIIHDQQCQLITLFNLNIQLLKSQEYRKLLSGRKSFYPLFVRYAIPL